MPFGQYQASPAVLRWPGDGNCYLMHKMQSGGWPYLYDRWLALSLCSCPLKIVATVQAIVTSRVVGAHTCTRYSMFLVWFRVWYEMNKENSKLMCIGFHSQWWTFFYFPLIISWYIPAVQLCAKCRQEIASVAPRPHLVRTSLHVWYKKGSALGLVWGLGLRLWSVHVVVRERYKIDTLSKKLTDASW